MRIAIVAGTRPEAIKVAPVVRLLKRTQGIETLLVSSGQHKEMLAQAFADFHLSSDVDLGVMTPGQTLASLSSSLFSSLDALLEREKPDVVLVQGDTTTVFAAATCAFYRGIPVGHIEAGLRSHRLDAPFPEEFNRRAAGLVATWHFAPTRGAQINLIREGVAADSVILTGNTVIDALLWMKEHGGATMETLPPIVRDQLEAGRRLLLVTGHRRENFGGGFESICKALRELSAAYPDVCIIYPVHLNPNVLGPVHKTLNNCQNVLLIEPLTYKPFIALMDASYLILTDSGGVQEEAPALGKPVLVMREVTERPEGVEAGTARLVGTAASNIVQQASRLLDDVAAYAAMAQATNPYGDGHAAERIRDVLIR